MGERKQITINIIRILDILFSHFTEERVPM